MRTEDTKFLAAIRKAAAEGLSMPETAVKLGVNYSKVYNYAARNHVGFSRAARKPRGKPRAQHVTTPAPEAPESVAEVTPAPLPEEPNPLRNYYTGVKVGLSRWGGRT